MSDPEPVLSDVLARTKALGPRGVVVFDLDSTVLDNRPRQARIVREYGRARGLEPLLRAQPSDWATSWSMREALRRMGLPEQAVESTYRDARAFWMERFFTSDYCVEDRACPGAAAFVRRVRQAGAQIAYVTGRHEGMREGTLETLRREGFEVPGPAIHLLLKPTFEMHDDDWKIQAQEKLREVGEVVAVFENEPTHANAYRRAFPSAIVVHLATDHSGRLVDLLPGIVSIPGFAPP